jgi:elongation factor 1 alpha-like protein
MLQRHIRTKSPRIINMSKQRVKSVGLDDDYDNAYDDYDEEEDAGLNEEDKEQMRLGTTKVREALGSDIPATNDEIQEALWHYYYDIAKSVSYIKSKSRLP